jgi:hypothetical protein
MAKRFPSETCVQSHRRRFRIAPGIHLVTMNPDQEGGARRAGKGHSRSLLLPAVDQRRRWDLPLGFASGLPCLPSC